MKIGDCGVYSNRAADQGDAFVAPSELGVECAEEMEGVGVIGILGEDLAVEGFGLREAAGLVMGESGLEGLFEGEFGHGGGGSLGGFL